MKKVLTILFIAALTGSAPAVAQTTTADTITHQQRVAHKLMQHRYVSPQDSIRLVHYLIGYGWLEGDGIFVKNRHIYIDSVLQIIPWNADIWMQKSYIPLFAGKFEIGMPYLDSAVKYDPEDYLSYRGYIKCILQKNHREAITDLIKARSLYGEGHTEDHSNNFYLGLCYLQLDRFDSCQALFTSAIDQQRRDYGYQVVHYLNWYYLGIAHYEQDDYPAAISCFDSCLARYPQFADAKFYKAWSLCELKQYNAAADLMKQAGEDLQQGYTINEDNAKYEPYPYQVNKTRLEESIEILNKIRNK